MEDVLPNYTGAISQSTKVRVEELINHVTATTEDVKESKMGSSICAILTSISLDIGMKRDGDALTFFPNFASRLKVEDGSNHKPDLVAFFSSLRDANKIIRGEVSEGSVVIPPAHAIVAPVELKVEEDAIPRCFRYIFAVSRHIPASPLQYGVVANRNGFKLLALGLDEQFRWQLVEWSHRDCVDRLYTCVECIVKEQTKKRDPAVPQVILKSEFTIEERPVFIYNATVGQKKFHLLPLFYGRGNGRKPFVAVAVPADGPAGNPDIIRIFKYSWYPDVQRRREYDLLLKLVGVPGVVQIDATLSRVTLETDALSKRVQSLLILQTIGYPLCSCSSVLEFLEAMYDLLEVLCCLVQEKEILHRDVSWSNVLIRPEHTASVNINIRSTPTDEPIPHKYRFIKDIFPNNRVGIRVALADFDHASDLTNSSEQELKGATGTPMFMAHDVLNPRKDGVLFGRKMSERLRQKATFEGSRMKYADASEKSEWDAFYSNLRNIDYVDEEDFKHGAVHDAESVFCLCLLFFNRLQRTSRRDDEISKDDERKWGDAFEKLASKHVLNPSAAPDVLDALLPSGFDESFVDMLTAINDYLKATWYSVVVTGRRERYEFHMHDFMQRLILKEILKLCSNNDPIPIEEKPRRVRMRDIKGNAFASSSKGLSSVLGKQRKNNDEKSLRSFSKLLAEDNDLGSKAYVTRHDKDRSVFRNSHFDLVKYKKREKLWFVADAWN